VQNTYVAIEEEQVSDPIAIVSVVYSKKRI
jgi:hypothetical protein